MTKDTTPDVAPQHLIDNDEILRGIDHSISHKMFNGWMLAQGFIGSVLVMFVNDLYEIGLALFASSLIAGTVKMVWASRAGLYQAAKETTLNSPSSKRNVLRVSIISGVVFGMLMGLAGVFILFTEDPIGLQILFGSLCGVGFGISTWFMNGFLKKQN